MVAAMTTVWSGLQPIITLPILMAASVTEALELEAASGGAVQLEGSPREVEMEVEVEFEAEADGGGGAWTFLGRGGGEPTRVDHGELLEELAAEPELGKVYLDELAAEHHQEDDRRHRADRLHHEGRDDRAAPVDDGAGEEVGGADRQRRQDAEQRTHRSPPGLDAPFTNPSVAGGQRGLEVVHDLDRTLVATVGLGKILAG